MNERRLRTTAIVAALVVHLGAVGGVWAVNELGVGLPGSHAKPPEAIEAGLAIRKKNSKGRKSRLPQKTVDRTAKPPEGPTLTRDPNATAAKPDDKKAEPPPPDLADPNSVFDKYRNMDTPGKETPVGEGEADDTQEGVDEGSDYGTVEDARGDPYVGLMVGHLTTNPDAVIPAFVPKGLTTQICVSLHPDGRFASIEMPDELKSPNPTFNSAILKRAKESQPMPEPVPDHLRALLVERGICIRRTYN